MHDLACCSRLLVSASHIADLGDKAQAARPPARPTQQLWRPVMVVEQGHPAASWQRLHSIRTACGMGEQPVPRPGILLALPISTLWAPGPGMLRFGTLPRLV